MLDKSKRYLIVGLGLLGGKYALELSRAGFHVDGINRSEGHLQYALDHGYIASGKTLSGRPTISSLACTPRPCSSGSGPTATC